MLVWSDGNSGVSRCSPLTKDTPFHLCLPCLPEHSASSVFPLVLLFAPFGTFLGSSRTIPGPPVFLLHTLLPLGHLVHSPGVPHPCRFQISARPVCMHRDLECFLTHDLVQYVSSPMFLLQEMATFQWVYKSVSVLTS